MRDIQEEIFEALNAKDEHFTLEDYGLRPRMELYTNL